MNSGEDSAFPMFSSSSSTSHKYEGSVCPPYLTRRGLTRVATALLRSSSSPKRTFCKLSLLQVETPIHSTAQSDKHNRNKKLTATKLHSQQHKLSTSTVVFRKSLTKALAMARGKVLHVETWQGSTTNNVSGKVGHQDSFPGGETSKYGKPMESHDIHGWLIAALLREMWALEGKVMFQCVDGSFTFNRCLRQGSVQVPRQWHMMAAQQKNMGLLLDVKGRIRYVSSCGRHVPHQKKFGTDVM